MPEATAAAAADEIIRLDSISVTYRSMRGDDVTGCEGVSLSIGYDMSVGLVGESGHGKSTILSVVSGSRSPDSGTASFRGSPYRVGSSSWRREFYRSVQFVGQNPYAAFNPRLSILGQVASPARFLRGMLPGKAAELAYQMLAAVGLDREVGALKPSALSGGMLQRTAVARALICEPQCLVLDEPTASLSPEGTHEVVEVLKTLRKQGRCSILVTSHDLDVMAGLCDDVHVVYGGKIVDRGPLERLRTESTDEYTRLLMSAWHSALPAT